MPRIFQEKLIDGLIIIWRMLPDIVAKIETFFEQAIWVESSVWHPNNCIRRDEVATGELVAQALLDAGCRHLLWVGPPPVASSHFSVAQRLEGARRTAHVAQVPMEIHEPEDPYIISEELVRGWTPRTGVIAYNSLIAQVLANQAGRFGKSTRRDFGLVSCDSEADGAVTFPQLSRAEFDRFGMGVTAAEMFLRMQSGLIKKRASQLVSSQWIAGTTLSLY